MTLPEGRNIYFFQTIFHQIAHTSEGQCLVKS